MIAFTLSILQGNYIFWLNVQIQHVTAKRKKKQKGNNRIKSAKKPQVAIN